MRRAALVVVVGAFASTARAQTFVTLRGVAYDSVRGAPLAGAFVTLDATRIVTAGARGAFAFDSVMTGAHTLTAQHASLDTIGISGLRTAVRLVSTTDVTLATPSFATLWRELCNRPAPADSALVLGIVTDATGALPNAGAAIVFGWVDVLAHDTTDAEGVHVATQRGHTVARTDARGAYVACGVPDGVAVRARAVADSGTSGLLDLASDRPRVLRRDFRVAAALEARVGSVTGAVSDSTGRPVPNARLLVDDVEIRGDDAGRFTARNVPIGTRQVEATALGMSPAITTIDVEAGSTVTVGLTLRRVNQLDVVRVTASPAKRRLIAGIDERRRQSHGYFRDSTAIAGRGTLASVFSDFPGIQVERSRGAGTSFILTSRAPQGRCRTAVLIDGRRGDYELLESLRPSDIGVVEVYPTANRLPTDIATNEPGAGFYSCGMIAVWTKRVLP